MEYLKHITVKERGFRGGMDDKMMRMRLGREIVVAGLPPLSTWPVQLVKDKRTIITLYIITWLCVSHNFNLTVEIGEYDTCSKVSS